MGKARCVRNVLAAAACRAVGGWMGGWVGGVKSNRTACRSLKSCQASSVLLCLSHHLAEQLQPHLSAWKPVIYCTVLHFRTSTSKLYLSISILYYFILLHDNSLGANIVLFSHACGVALWMAMFVISRLFL